MHKLSENYKALQLIVPKSITATETGTGVDVEAYEGDAMAIFSAGSLAGTTETNICTIETSVIGDFTDAVVAVTFGTLTGSSGDNKMGSGGFKLDPKVKKVRAIVTKDSTGAALVSVVLLVESQAGGSTLNSTTPA